MDKLIYILKTYPDQINALIALLALVGSITSIIFTYFTLKIQRLHNYKTLLPIIGIRQGDYEERLIVSVVNKGIGPMLVTYLTVSDGVEEKKSLIDWMPTLPQSLSWKAFYSDIDGLCIHPNESVILLELMGDPTDLVFIQARDNVRRALSKLIVETSFTDIYDNKMPVKVKPLTWFARQK